MAIFKCKMCGGDLTITDLDKVVECDYCGTTQTVPSADSEKKLTLFNRANRLRLANEFDKAAGIYENIIAEFPEEAEAYWGLCLCNYGIEYVDDPATGKKIPTCHRASFEKLTRDENFELAMEYADVRAQKVYRDEAREIDRINEEILSVSKNETPYDLFICYKETDESGSRTPDSVMAQDIYDALTAKGYKVFFARISLEDKLGQQYEPYIFAALNSAKIMLCVGTKYEYFHAVWVKNEWSRFVRLAAKDKSKTLIPCYRDMDPYDLPDAFKGLQAQDLGKLGAMQDLVRGVEKISPSKKEHTSNGSYTSNQSSLVKELSYDNGVYTGEAIGNRPQGVGTRYYTNGDKYVGSWYLGKKQGNGTITYKNGSSWSGEWDDDKPKNGSGVYCYRLNNVAFRIEGTLKNFKPTGNCKRYADGLMIESGSFLNGKMEGKGTVYKNGKILCEGEWKNGRPWNAKGTFAFNDNWTYSGKWIDGLISGPGLLQSKKGERLAGVFDKGLNSERVVWRFVNGGEYVGPIKEGKRTGFGKLFNSNKHLDYEGDFIDNAATGKGTMYIKTGSRYEGSLVKGVFEGEGTLYYPDGKQWTGIWKNNQPWTGNGLILWYDNNYQPNGHSYEGALENGKANGDGIRIFPDKTRFVGSFRDDLYYNGHIYSANNQMVDTYINGESKSKKQQEKINKVASTALKFFGL